MQQQSGRNESGSTLSTSSTPATRSTPSTPLAVLALGLLLPVAAFCQTQNRQQTPAAQSDHIASATESPAPPEVAPEEQATDEQLKQLFATMRIREQLATVTKTMPAMMQQQISSQIKSLTANLPGGQSATPEQQEALENFTKKYMDKAINMYPADEMIADMSTIYKRHLTRDDVDSLIAFYNSPAGQHLLNMTPAIMKEYMPLVMSWMQERSKALTAEMTKELQEMAPGAAPAK